MKKRKILFIINKKARRVNSEKIKPKIKQFFKVKYPNIDIDFKITKNISEGSKEAKKAVGKYNTVVAVGGDGTINSVLQSVVNKNINFGIIPLGTGNALSFETGMLRKMFLACQTVAECHTKIVDVGLLKNHLHPKGRYFLLMFGAGVDAWVLDETEKNQFMKQTMGRFPYIMTSLRAGLAYKQPRVRVKIDGDKEIAGYQTVISNIKYYSLIFRLTPFAKMDDGYLDACVIQKSDLFNCATIYFQSAVHAHVKRKDVHYKKGKTFKVISDTDMEVPIHIDGELAGNTPATIKVVPSAVRLIIPEGNGSLFNQKNGKKKKSKK